MASLMSSDCTWWPLLSACDCPSILNLPPPPHQVLFLNDRLTPEGGMLFAGDSTGAVYQWDLGRRELVSSWKGHEGSVWGLHMATFALISGGLDGMVKLWDPRTRELIRQLYKHTSSVCSFSVQANVFYSCAVDNIIKVWDWKDGTCLGTMHGHRETVANLCLTPEGTLFSSGIDKMVKVWKPPGSWGEEWHGLRELDLTTAGMVAEDVDRLEKQLRGEAAKWVSLSVSNNHLYDEGIGKLVKVSATDGHRCSLVALWLLSGCSLVALWLLSGCSLVAL